ncbi:helix-turn-helix domain-containing protein [Brevibacillus choshinensis]|uniref:PucR family transcriptional regulator n=1 Tax=Brevibacillus choshinensis TaxID=54911 RepID=UPI002E1F6AFA|nr:helix-turn-helix domain-containing protein [Brevibacillus choshinensis]
MEQWMNHAERIRQETGLPIVCLQISQNEADQIRHEQEQKGWELVASAGDGTTVTLVLIETTSWHASARALLGLFFSSATSKSEAILTDQVSTWLQSISSDSPLPPPSRLEQQWSWREKRAVFLIERCRPESTLDWYSLQPLLHDFFKGEHTSLTFIPLGHLYYLLLVPISMLGNQNEPDEHLEWASGVHDLIANERMEHVRLLVSFPIATPLQLEKAVRQLFTLSHALTQFCPRVMVAGSWHYPLEQWAITLPTGISQKLARSIQSELTAHPLTEEQMETLETLFRCHLNISDTSRQLFLHRNTLLYRLDKLTEQTGLDPRQFSHAVLLKLFLLFRQN